MTEVIQWNKMSVVVNLEVIFIVWRLLCMEARRTFFYLFIYFSFYKACVGRTADAERPKTDPCSCAHTVARI